MLMDILLIKKEQFKNHPSTLDFKLYKKVHLNRKNKGARLAPIRLKN